MFHKRDLPPSRLCSLGLTPYWKLIKFSYARKDIHASGSGPSSTKPLSLKLVQNFGLASVTGVSPKKPAGTEDKLLVSRREAAARLSISQRAVDYLIANNSLVAKRIGTRVLIPVNELRRFANSDHPRRLAS